jgi:hypothetical protein
MILQGEKEANCHSWNDVEKALPNAKIARTWGRKFHCTTKGGAS